MLVKFLLVFGCESFFAVMGSKRNELVSIEGLVYKGFIVSFLFRSSLMFHGTVSDNLMTFVPTHLRHCILYPTQLFQLSLTFM